ncbi:MAG: hypothetical protein ACN4E2_04650 [Nitrospinota bacterium]
MKKLTKLVPLLILLLIFGCATGQLYKKGDLIKKGDTKEKVTKLLGPAIHKSTTTHITIGYEAWQYCETGIYENNYLVVVFSQNKVAVVDTYKGDLNLSLAGPPHCISEIRMVKWDNYYHDLSDL